MLIFLRFKMFIIHIGKKSETIKVIAKHGRKAILNQNLGYIPTKLDTIKAFANIATNVKIEKVNVLKFFICRLLKNIKNNIIG